MSAPSARNLRLVGHTDQGGRPDGVQFMLHRSGYGFVGQTYAEGVSILDLRDPAHPAPAGFIAMPPNTRASHIQLHDDLLFVANGPNPAKSLASANYFTRPLADTQRRDLEFAAGFRVYDVARPTAPREVGALAIDGLGVHRMWYVGGRHLYCSAHFAGFSDHILAIVDVADPARPEVVGRWWHPGMWRAGGETASWKGRYALHHALVAGNLAYGAWRDGGLTVHDVSDPATPRLLVHRHWSPPFGGGTHSPLPLPDRNLLIVADEATADNCADGVKCVWVFDVREPANPVSIATMPRPGEADYCIKGAKFGPHNLHENRPGLFQSSSLVFATWYNAGVRVFDIADPFAPREVGHFVPPPPERMMKEQAARPRVIQSCDVLVDRRGLVYVTDTNAGLYILEFEGAR
ncbi:MAG: LVIVD repeat-containing protein [Stellaceae bacterium]